jgi:hypothetical protein
MIAKKIVLIIYDGSNIFFIGYINKISLRLAVIPCIDRLLHNTQATAKMW